MTQKTIFSEEPIYTYLENEAVEDGILFDVAELNKLSVSNMKFETGFSHITSNLLFSKGYAVEGEKLSLPNFIDLFRQCAIHMVKQDKKTGSADHFYSCEIEFPSGSKGKVFICENSSSRFTIMLPEDY